MGDNPAQAWKAVERIRARARRQQLGNAHLASVGAALTTHLAPILDGLDDDAVVLGYSAMPDEVPVNQVLSTATARGLAVALPRVVGPGDMVLHLVTGDPDEMTRGAFDIPEPRADLPTVVPRALGLILVPGVSYDRSGRRLGMGAGFYDRLIPLADSAMTVGICAEALLLDVVLTEPHDADVDAVVTEAGVYR